MADRVWAAVTDPVPDPVAEPVQEGIARGLKDGEGVESRLRVAVEETV